MTAATATVIDWVEQGLVPDLVVRRGIRALLRQRLADLPKDCEAAAEHKRTFIAGMDAAPIALVPHLANEQHYEVPADFFAAVLGPRRKYSACYWGDGVSDLAAAEEASLALTAERAGIADGQRVLELGCGWGSFSLWAAERYPRAQITAVSNSASQRASIEQRARDLGLRNLRVITSDMSDLVLDGGFDRVVSIEMFEHMRNYRRLLGRIHDWLAPGGRLFIHIFCHREHPYAFEDRGPSDWMSRHFFSGGIMPSDDLLLHFQDELRLVDRWRWDGRHYERTLNAWLAQMDRERARVRPILEATYGQDQADVWWRRWRVFFMACAELFGYREGQEWWVGHYLLERPSSP
ncbi:MAG: cyclopropane-fatty-acyl-phospholipid synthase family protein [Chromatiaceae bacterium]|jgi:cyclopropane-fatty-acyl-phospholipid synthase|nr:cyclopropane-fatty-acyl-phospholipid synthase family protein [Chromatiaceae bacterium]